MYDVHVLNTTKFYIPSRSTVFGYFFSTFNI